MFLVAIVVIIVVGIIDCRYSGTVIHYCLTVAKNMTASTTVINSINILSINIIIFISTNIIIIDSVRPVEGILKH